MRNGKSVSCTLYDSDESTVGEVEHSCNISENLLLKYFGPDYKRAERLTIDSATIAGDRPVLRETPDGRRVTIEEAVVTIGPDGRAQACHSRLPLDGLKESFDDCVGYQTGRKFTGLTTFVRVIDWTLRFPVPITASAPVN